MSEADVEALANLLREAREHGILFKGFDAVRCGRTTKLVDTTLARLAERVRPAPSAVGVVTDEMIAAAQRELGFAVSDGEVRHALIAALSLLPAKPTAKEME